MARRNIQNGEKGATFITILVGLFVLAIFLLMAVEPASTVMQREKEAELIFRGEQICEAIRNYQKEHGGASPNELKELLKQGPKKIPYLRRLYRNPFDPDGKWCYLAPGTTAIKYNADGTKEILPGGGIGSISPSSQQGQNQYQPRGGLNQQDTGLNPQQGGTEPGQPLPKILPFKLDGKEGEPILGVCAKWKKPAFRKYMDTNDINEWFFSPLVIQPRPPVNLNPIPAQLPGSGESPPTPIPQGPSPDDGGDKE